MRNTQPETTTHHVMYCLTYFEAYDNVTNSIKERFLQADFHIQNTFINAINQTYTERNE